MFDLFRSRDKAVRITLSVLLGLVGLSMVTYLIPTTGNDTGNPADRTVVATIGKQDLTSQEVSKQIQLLTRNRQIPPELLSIYVSQTVQQMISDRAMAYEAARLGIRVSSDETDNAIMDSLPPEATKGGKVDSAMMAAVLQQQGLSMADLKDDTARQILISRLHQIVTEGVVVSPREIADEFHRKNDKVRLDYALIAPAKFQAEAEPSEAEIKAYYDAHKSSFQTPEKHSLAVVLIDPAKIAIQQVSDAVLQKEYNANIDKYKTAERVQARHILIKSDASNDAAKKAKAEGLLKQIQAGADFAKLAKENSDDPGSAAMGGELGFIVKGQTVPEFEKAAFSLQPGQTSGLVKTTYGYHIIQVEKHEQAHTQPFEEVRPQLFQEYVQRTQQAQLEQLADKAVAEMRKDPAHPEKAAEAVGGTVIRAENIQAGDPIPGIGVSKEITDAAAPLRKGEVAAGPVVLPGNKVAIVSVTDYQAAHPASLDEVRTDVRNKASQDKLQEIVSKKAAELAAKAQANGGDLAKAAKEMGIELKTSPDVNRQAAIEGIGSASSLPDAFTKPVGAVFGPVAVPGGRVVAKIVAKTPADLAELPAQSSTIRDELRQAKTRDRNTMFEDGLKKRLQDDGKLKIHQDVIARLLASFNQRG
ncbi:MAG TPA: peptidyl-prolyl cis-trans isomerase [Bryobacteraceae bacterium]|jgi:peptidyl-prolyl cis-trans isomerase D|nr:peptidyl-prolyl cis-trans isomerase [Bryobacteraceae bacterium]